MIIMQGFIKNKVLAYLLLLYMILSLALVVQPVSSYNIRYLNEYVAIIDDIMEPTYYPVYVVEKTFTVTDGPVINRYGDVDAYPNILLNNSALILYGEDEDEDIVNLVYVDLENGLTKNYVLSDNETKGYARKIFVELYRDSIVVLTDYVLGFITIYLINPVEDTISGIKIDDIHSILSVSIYGDTLFFAQYYSYGGKLYLYSLDLRYLNPVLIYSEEGISYASLWNKYLIIDNKIIDLVENTTYELPIDPMKCIGIVSGHGIIAYLETIEDLGSDIHRAQLSIYYVENASLASTTEIVLNISRFKYLSINDFNGGKTVLVSYHGSDGNIYVTLLTIDNYVLTMRSQYYIRNLKYLYDNYYFVETIVGPEQIYPFTPYTYIALLYNDTLEKIASFMVETGSPHRFEYPFVFNNTDLIVYAMRKITIYKLLENATCIPGIKKIVVGPPILVPYDSEYELYLNISILTTEDYDNKTEMLIDIRMRINNDPENENTYSGLLIDNNVAMFGEWINTTIFIDWVGSLNTIGLDIIISITDHQYNTTQYHREIIIENIILKPIIGEPETTIPPISETQPTESITETETKETKTETSTSIEETETTHTSSPTSSYTGSKTPENTSVYSTPPSSEEPWTSIYLIPIVIIVVVLLAIGIKILRKSSI